MSIKIASEADSKAYLDNMHRMIEGAHYNGSHAVYLPSTESIGAVRIPRPADSIIVECEIKQERPFSYPTMTIHRVEGSTSPPKP